MNTSRETVFCEFPEDVADAAAALIHTAQEAAIRERGAFRIALSGGSTPQLLYETLLAEWREEMRWERWEIFWGDERAVPPESEHSNYGVAKELLLAHVPVGTIFRMGGEADDLAEAAREYEATLIAKLPELAFDLVLLGMGDDGHTASLFPGGSSLISTRLVEAVETNAAIPNRLTLTPKLLNRAREILFLVTGENKAEKVKAILADDNSAFPAAKILPEQGRVRWLLDEAAASLLA